MKKFAFLVLCLVQLYADDLTWNAPQILSTAGLNASDPRVGMDGNGNLVAAWIENGIVKGNTLPFNGSWGASTVQISNSGATSLELVVDPAGNATGIWNQGGIIQTSSLPFNGAWSSPINLSASGASSPQIVVDSFGNVATIWVCNGIIQSATKTYNGNWPQSPDVLSPDSPESDSPQISIGDGGTIVAVWHSTISPGMDAIFSNQKTLNGNWYAQPQLISNTAYLSVYPQLAVNTEGKAMAAWFRYDYSAPNYSNVIVQTSFDDEFGVWSSPTDLSSPGCRNPDELVLHVSYNLLGISLVTWTNSYDFCTFSLEGSVYNSTEWIPTVKFLESNLYLYDQNFSVSSQGYACAAYMEYDSSSSLPVIQAFGANTFAVIPNYGTQITISSGGSNGYPRTAVSQVGSTRRAAVIWLNNNGSNTVVQAAIGQEAVIAPPTSLAVVQSSNNFGIFTEYYNTLTWQGTVPANAKQWLVFRNGKLIGETATDVFEFIDHNAEQNQPAAYGVAIQLLDGDQSQVSWINFP